MQVQNSLCETLTAADYNTLLQDGVIPPDPSAIISEHTMLMSEIQIRSIVDRLDTEVADQGTDGDETMLKDGKTISKFSKAAMKIGSAVAKGVRNALSILFNQHIGQDKVFPTQNGPPKILTQFKDNPYEYELREE